MKESTNGIIGVCWIIFLAFGWWWAITDHNIEARKNQALIGASIQVGNEVLVIVDINRSGFILSNGLKVGELFIQKNKIQ